MAKTTDKKEEVKSETAEVASAEPETTPEEAKVEKKRANRALAKLAKMQKGFWSDFKAFISKGNILQLAIALVMGTAFTAIVTSLVNDIFMPLIGVIFKGTDIGKLSWYISPDLTIVYGKFILAVVNFLLIAFCLFLVVKIITRAEKEMKALRKLHPEKAEVAAAPALTKTEELLTEIKELLKKDTENHEG